MRDGGEAGSPATIRAVAPSAKPVNCRRERNPAAEVPSRFGSKGVNDGEFLFIIFPRIAAPVYSRPGLPLRPVDHLSVHIVQTEFEACSGGRWSD
jgi:hypothetical protein